MRNCFIDLQSEETTDNYRLLCEKWRLIYRELDREGLARRFHLESDATAYFITYYQERYRLDKESGMLTLEAEPERELSFNTVMAIYHLFYYSKPDAKVSGQFVPFREVKRAAPFDAAFRRTILEPLAAAFEGHEGDLRKACLALDGRSIPQGDVGYQIEAFDCMPLQVVFWDGDEEFRAQANILFDADITDFLHEETVVCVASELFRRLKEEAWDKKETKEI